MHMIYILVYFNGYVACIALLWLPTARIPLTLTPSTCFTADAPYCCDFCAAMCALCTGIGLLNPVSDLQFAKAALEDAAIKAALSALPCCAGATVSNATHDCKGALATALNVAHGAVNCMSAKLILEAVNAASFPPVHTRCRMNLTRIISALNDK